MTLVRAFEADTVDLIESPQAHRLRRNADLADTTRVPSCHISATAVSQEAQRDETNPNTVAAHRRGRRPEHAGDEGTSKMLDHATVIEVAGRNHDDVLDDERVKRTVVAFLRKKDPTPSAGAR